MPGKIWVPKIMFDFFPYFNDERVGLESSNYRDIEAHKNLETVSAEELNVMPYEEFQMIMDVPPVHYVTSPSTVQMQLASDSNLNNGKRGVMIDRLIVDDAEPDLVKKLLKLYNETESSEVKDKIVQDLMLYNQRHRNVESYIENDRPLLKSFFAEFLNAKSLSPKMADDAIRGFIDTHSADEVMTNLDLINKWLPIIGHYSSIMLKYTLVFKSKELQRTYIKSIVDELREANNSDLDSYLFGPLSMGYQNTGKGLLEPESKKIVLDYLKEVHYKYTRKGRECSSNCVTSLII
ncbi:hypothetical protein [Legionella brunensis]|uniref:Uncharacterized protein n=1 Tax=Legionella brunensis TaxID=29422 RepID=A0A0W0SEB9_9GAMM|nr:hypothetical protein [Legionella brunensis]KTC81719.1 hypothetical protein Lbru_2239 [Legionella brunensis]